MPDVYVGVGSNIDPEANISTALTTLKEKLGDIAVSSVYKNPPIGFDGDDFLNLVLRFETDSDPAAVEQLLGDLEQRAGRERTSAGPGPRILDLDLLLYGSRVDARLKLPHEDILKYPFVLCSLAELAPDLLHPITGILIADSWSDMANTNPPLTNIGSPAKIATGLRTRSLDVADS